MLKRYAEFLRGGGRTLLVVTDHEGDGAGEVCFCGIFEYDFLDEVDSPVKIFHVDAKHGFMLCDQPAVFFSVAIKSIERIFCKGEFGGHGAAVRRELGIGVPGRAYRRGAVNLVHVIRDFLCGVRPGAGRLRAGRGPRDKKKRIKVQLVFADIYFLSYTAFTVSV